MKRKKPKQKLTKTRILWFAAMLTAVAVLLFSTGQLIKIYWEYEVGTSEYDALQQYVERAPEPTKQPPKDDKVSEPQDSEATPAPVEEEPAYLPPQVDFEALKAINPDIVGWIEIEAIPSISYPIVKGMDNDKYLHTTFENTKNSAGAIFMDYTNASNFTDCNTLIYGHNMKNGSMFGLLKNLRDKELYKESPYFWICTPEEISAMKFFPPMWQGKRAIPIRCSMTTTRHLKNIWKKCVR